MGLARTFIGFSSTDIQSYWLMLAWKANENIDFNFSDCQLHSEVNSENEQYIKRGMANNKHTHNIFLQSTLEYGIIGFITILAMFILSYHTVSREFRLMIFLITMTTFLQLSVGIFERDLNPLAYLLVVGLIVQQDKSNNKANIELKETITT